jgi:hypothetical protein
VHQVQSDCQSLNAATKKDSSEFGALLRSILLATK